MRSTVRKIFDDFYSGVELNFRKYKTRQDAKNITRKMGKVSPELEETYKTEIKPFWNKFKKNPEILWFQLFSRDGKVSDPRYIPEDMWYGEILPYFSNMSFRRAYEDKCIHNLIFPDLKRPRTIIKNIAGEYYTDDLTRIPKEEILGAFTSASDFIIKPSIDSGTGRLISFYKKDELSNKELLEVLEKYNCNFIVQEVVQQHEILSQIHSSSLNTIRILSFFFKGEVYILSAILRMGVGDSKIDNVSSGGMQCGINPDGSLFPEACTKSRDWVKEHPDGVVFAETTIPGFAKIIDLVKKEHQKLPHFRLIGWDFSVDNNEEPIFIEYNVCPGANQMTCGPTFGDLTEEVLEDVYVTKSLKDIQN